MFNKHTTALYAAVIATVLVASVFAISYVQQQAAAQGNQTTGGTNQSGTNSTSSGTATGSSPTGASSGPTY